MIKSLVPLNVEQDRTLFSLIVCLYQYMISTYPNILYGAYFLTLM